jgi:hypothetical protein
VRVRAYEFLLTLYFPDKNREAMITLLQNMILDNHDAVRVQGLRYIERADAVPDVLELLQRWRKIAMLRNWDKTESFEVVTRLLKEPAASKRD